jgi:hypothetical protein
VFYWRPIYGFVQRQGIGPEEAKDITQGFFADLLEHRSLTAVRKEKGGFRSYLLGALKYFLADERRRATINTSGNNNIALGVNAGSNVTTASDTICIGIVGVNVTDGCYIGHVFEEPLDPDNLTMAIDVHGKVGTLASSRRFKDDIKPMDKTSEAFLALKPVTFHYKSDKNCSPRFGLIAEEVANVDPNLVARDKEGKPYSVRYDQVNAMLLNEFLKEHRKVQELEKGMAGLTAQIKEQTAHIQKVSAQIQMCRQTTKVALKNP